jgi:hypothetical protein
VHVFRRLFRALAKQWAVERKSPLGHFAQLQLLLELLRRGQPLAKPNVKLLYRRKQFPIGDRVLSRFCFEVLQRRLRKQEIGPLELLFHELEASLRFFAADVVVCVSLLLRSWTFIVVYQMDEIGT